MDYYFDNTIGILLAENLHINRYDFKPEKPISFSSKDFYINRTLAMVNSNIIMDSYEKLMLGSNIGLNIIYFLSIISILAISLIGGVFIIRKKRKIRKI
ncbi:MAG: hypothetical protein ACFFD5_15175 [Candidatus Thorarchaeota archaeon]